MEASAVPESLPSWLESLLADEGPSANLERRQGRWRLRYRRADPATGEIRRRAVSLPDASWLPDRLEAFLRERRLAKRRIRQAREARGFLLRLKIRLQAASGRGRWIRRRLGRLLALSAVLGLEGLADFLGRRPWLAPGKPAGRPSRES